MTMLDSGGPGWQIPWNLATQPSLQNRSLGKPEPAKRWGEYKTDEPNAHGGFGNTDGFSKIRTNVDLCHERPIKAYLSACQGYMLPRPLMKHDMNVETQTEYNHKRRVKRKNGFDVFPEQDHERADIHDLPDLTSTTRRDLSIYHNKLHETAANQRVFVDHTAEIRRRVTEMIQRKREEERKNAIIVKAFLNPTAENWAKYREIANLTPADSETEKDCVASEEEEFDGEGYVPCREMPRCPDFEIKSTYGNNEEANRTKTSLSLPASITGQLGIATCNTLPVNGCSGLKPLKGILKTSTQETHKFLRPNADPKLVFAMATWDPIKRSKFRSCKRVRFKDDIEFPSCDVTDRCRPKRRCSTPYRQHVTTLPSLYNPNVNEPEALYYDKELVKDIPSRLGLRFKSEAHKRYHQKHTDPIPDLRDFTTYHKRYFFTADNFHSTAFRG